MKGKPRINILHCLLPPPSRPSLRNGASWLVSRGHDKASLEPRMTVPDPFPQRNARTHAPRAAWIAYLRRLFATDAAAITATCTRRLNPREKLAGGGADPATRYLTKKDPAKGCFVTRRRRSLLRYGSADTRRACREI